jgi:hypothetical protein
MGNRHRAEVGDRGSGVGIREAGLRRSEGEKVRGLEVRGKSINNQQS